LKKYNAKASAIGAYMTAYEDFLASFGGIFLIYKYIPFD